MSGNYESVREVWRQKFLQMDHEALSRRFGLDIDANHLYLTYFSHPCTIHRRTAKILRAVRFIEEATE